MNFWKKNLKSVTLKLKDYRMGVKNLKLIAKTEDDVRVLSAHLQDSIANTSDIANLKKK